jgi:hypothetical protein
VKVIYSSVKCLLVGVKEKLSAFDVSEWGIWMVNGSWKSKFELKKKITTGFEC